MLTVLIPVVDQVWLLLLILQNGQDGDNRYGTAPSSEVLDLFSRNRKANYLGADQTVCLLKMQIIYLYADVLASKFFYCPVFQFKEYMGK